MLLIDGVKYRLWTPSYEEKFEQIITERSKDIFGEDSVYFDLKQKLTSQAGIGSIPDGYVIDLTSPPSWYIVEVELSTHPLYEHIVVQLSKFINGLNNYSSRLEIINALHQIINSNPETLKFIRERLETREIYYFLTQLISKPPKLAVIIDENVDQLHEALKSIPLIEKVVVEFKIFERIDTMQLNGFLFQPIFSEKSEIKVPEQKRKISPKVRDLPDHRKFWKSRLEWVNPNTRLITQQLTNEINQTFSQTFQREYGRWLCFHNKTPPKASSIFAAFLINKNELKIRIRTDPNTFTDSTGLVKPKIYDGFFFKSHGQEREFSITNSNQVKDAINLISHSYNCT
jgi:hypothetical protein